MNVQREAKYLSGVDRGKHVKFVSPNPRHLTYEGKLVNVKHLGDGGTTLVIQTEDGRIEWDHVDPVSLVCITGGTSLHLSARPQDSASS